MRFTRLLVLIVSCCLSALVVPATLVPASAAPAQSTETVSLGRTYSTEVTVSMARRLVYRQQLSIRGQVQATNTENPDDRGALTGTAVRLERRWKGSDTWQVLARTTTSDTNTPTYSFTQRARRNATYRVVYDGETSTDGVETVTFQPDATSRVLRVSRRVTSRLANPRPGRYFLRGAVAPSWRGKPVTLQRKTCRSCTWRDYARQRTTSTGRFGFRIDFPRRNGTWFYRVEVRPTTDFVASYSSVYWARRS